MIYGTHGLLIISSSLYLSSSLKSQQGGNSRRDSATEQTPDTSDTSLKAPIWEDKENKTDRDNKEKEKEKEKDNKKDKKEKEKGKSKLFTRDKKVEPHTPPPGKDKDKK